MSFWVGLVLGMAFGIGAVVLFVRSENNRSNSRTRLAETVAAFARMTVEDSRKLLPPQYYPSWVVFSQQQKVTWLNLQMTKIWPYVNRKKLDFTLKVIGDDISAIPGVSDAVEGTIRDAIEDSITWPVRKIIPILPGDYSDLELKPVGTLEVKLVQAKELTNKDLIGKSDPYAKLYVRPLRDRMKTSKVINNDLNLIWNEHFEFIVEDKSTQNLVVKIYDDEGLQASEFIGCAHVHLKDLEPGKVKDVWLKLVKDLEIQRDTKNRGQVHLELLYCPFGGENGFTNPFAPTFSMTSLEKVLKSGVNGMDSNHSVNKKKEVIVRGVLSVTIISAEDLPPADLMGKADPYVLLRMKKSQSRNKTRVVNESLDPVWNQTFDFLVEDGLHDMLILELWDHDTFGKDYMGRCILTLTTVILKGSTRTLSLSTRPSQESSLSV